MHITYVRKFQLRGINWHLYSKHFNQCQWNGCHSRASSVKLPFTCPTHTPCHGTMHAAKQSQLQILWRSSSDFCQRCSTLSKKKKTIKHRPNYFILHTLRAHWKRPHKLHSREIRSRFLVDVTIVYQDNKIWKQLSLTAPFAYRKT